jgi:dihydroorotase-like cyclic amidohydrolase
LAAAEAEDGVDAGAAAGGVVACRCMPDDLPPPKRLAASASADTSVKATVSAIAISESIFIGGLLLKWNQTVLRIGGLSRKQKQNY